MSRKRKVMLLTVLIYVFAITFLYLSIAFICLSVNPTKWDVGGRVTMVFGAAILLIFSPAAYIIIYSQLEDK